MTATATKKKATGRANEVVTLKLPKLSLRVAKRAVIIEALRRSEGHAEEAAKLLKIGVSTMYRLISDFKITDNDRS